MKGTGFPSSTHYSVHRSLVSACIVLGWVGCSWFRSSGLFGVLGCRAAIGNKYPGLRSIVFQFTYDPGVVPQQLCTAVFNPQRNEQLQSLHQGMSIECPWRLVGESGATSGGYTLWLQGYVVWVEGS